MPTHANSSRAAGRGASPVIPEPEEGHFGETRPFRALLPGTLISHYKIVEKIGAGGMGVVYKAQDTKLDRTVALKFLPSHLVCDSEARDRFQHEAKAASALNHPNITTVHEIDEAGGECFISMEYVAGKSLKDMAREGTLSIDEVLRIGLQIGEGLKAAHAGGIVHRDIKSDNIKVTADGLVKIMDFGLAKLRGVAKITRTGTTLGTLQYMSPEQAQGREADQRSDIFSFGVVLYEMVTGRLPFTGDNEAALIHAVVNATSEPMARYKAGVPERLERLVEKAMTKNRDERYQHVDEVIADLKSTGRNLEPTQGAGERGGSPKSKRSRLYLYAGLALVVALAVLGRVWVFGPSREPIDSLAVLPLENLSGDPDQEYFSDGMTDALITELQKIRSLRVISRTSVMRFKKTEESLPEIAKALNVKAVVEGSVMREKNVIRINVQLIQASPEKHLWADSFDRDMNGVLVLQSDVARAIAQEVRVIVTPDEQKELASSRPVDPEAHEAYLKGRFYWNKRTGPDLQKAIGYFNDAIEKDSSYAQAYAGLASAYAVLPEYAYLPPSETVPKAEAAARKALQLDASLAEAHAVLGGIASDWASAESEYKRAIALDPSYATAHHWYSLNLRRHGRPDEALAEIRRAQELDPLSLIISENVGVTLSWMKRYDEALDQFKKMIELDPNFPWPYGDMAIVHAMQGRLDQAIAEYQKEISIVGRDPSEISALGYLYALAGKKREAVSILDELLKFDREGYRVSVYVAMVHYGLGDTNRAFEWLERAYQEQDGALLDVGVSPLWAGLHSDPRFTALLRKMGLAD
jgi:eukaryotic-like serine/threonine-protein kinase